MMRIRGWQKTILVARGFLLATALYSSLYAWWLYGDAPGGTSGPMYAWIRHFYGSCLVALIAVVGFVLTFAGAGRGGGGA